MKRKIIITLLFFVILSSAIPNYSCSQPIVSYKLYEMESDDIRLRFLEHPLFSLEYPETFKLVDLNLTSDGLPPVPMTLNVSETNFINHKNIDLQEPTISIRIEKPGFAYNNADEKFQHLMLNASDYAEKYSISKVGVFGISADYLESNSYGKLFVGKTTQKTLVSIKTIVFGFADLIWEISLNWTYLDVEPPEAQEYFNHVIETFKILD